MMIKDLHVSNWESCATIYVAEAVAIASLPLFCTSRPVVEGLQSAADARIYH